LALGQRRWKRRGVVPAPRLGLNPWQMRRCNVIVRRGERVDDEALAPGVIRAADRVMRPQRLERYSWFMFGAVGLVALTTAVFDFDAGDIFGGLGSSLFCLLLFAASIGFAPWRRNQIKKARQARDYATRLL
jgi:hypothetical protein